MYSLHSLITGNAGSIVISLAVSFPTTGSHSTSTLQLHVYHSEKGVDCGLLLCTGGLNCKLFEFELPVQKAKSDL
jgi:hypothetical protein